jgi:hypothetical protein
MNFVGGSLKLKGLAPKPITQLTKSKDIKKDKKKKDKKDHKSSKHEKISTTREDIKDTILEKP